MGYSFTLPAPPRVTQPTRESCWAACIASLVNAAESGNVPPWFGGDANAGGLGSMAALDANAVISMVEGEEDAPGQLVDPVTKAFSADGPKLSRLYEVFGLSAPRLYRHPDDIAALPATLRDLLVQQNYVMLMFTNPAWGKDSKGGAFWHGWVLHGFHDGPSKSGATFFRGMDPDPLKEGYPSTSIARGQQYIISHRHATLRPPSL
jgi:hypothetical protein